MILSCQAQGTLSSAPSQLDCLHANNLACSNREPEAGSHLMQSGVPAGARVHVDKVEIKVPHDFQDVGMAANEETRLCIKDDFFRPRVVTAWIAADMRHTNTKALTCPMQVLRKLAANLRPINIPVHAANRFKLAQSFQDFHRTKVAGMPHFIALREILKQGFVQEAVSVRNEADPHRLHSGRLRGPKLGCPHGFRAPDCGGLCAFARALLQ